MMLYSSTVINNSCCSLFNEGLNMGFDRFSPVTKEHYDYNHIRIYLKK